MFSIILTSKYLTCHKQKLSKVKDNANFTKFQSFLMKHLTTKNHFSQKSKLN